MSSRRRHCRRFFGAQTMVLALLLRHRSPKSAALAFSSVRIIGRTKRLSQWHYTNQDQRQSPFRFLSSIQPEIIEDLYEEDDTKLHRGRSNSRTKEISIPPLPLPTKIRPCAPPSQEGPNRDTPFEITAPFPPMGDQPEAIEQLLKQLKEGDRFSILKGITGTGKTLVMSHVIARRGKPTLVLCHNKTLAAQLARELRSFLGNSAVELFVSYYNYYLPESYNESTGTFVAKKSSINQDIDFMRHRATRALLTRQDVVVVASVSCIYGLGLPKDYLDASMELQVGDVVDSPEDFLSQLDTMLYTNERLDDEFGRGKYQYTTTNEHCDITLWPPHESFPLRIRLEPSFDTVLADQDSWMVKSIQQGHVSGHSPISFTYLFPAKHHVMSEDRMDEACLAIEAECEERVKELVSGGKIEESARLQQRVTNDLLMLRETGFCSGAENYSRHFAQRLEGQPPDTLMDYLSLNGRDWLLMVDESHVTVPQLRAMYGGDRARKQRLVKHGYRLPSALDNRPLKEVEFWQRVPQAVFVSATPSGQEVEWAERDAVEMVIRPTFVCDPVIEVRPSEGQLEDLVEEVRSRAKKQERSLALALTKVDAEDLSDYLNEHGVSSTFIHSGLNTHERADALKALQNGEVDCLVGVNLLREGLDLPQVSLVAILNADSEGFLRSETGLLQMVGRAARNIEGTAIFYAKRITQSMQRCIDATGERREKQLSYNRDYNCQMKSTKGSSMLSIFDLLKDQIAEEQQLEVVGRKEIPPRSISEVVTKNGFIRPDMTVEVPGQLPALTDVASSTVNTDHIPSTSGVYFWKDGEGNVLYIGKAKKLRSRVKSYLAPNAKHSTRIEVMMEKARSIDFILTKSDRDALLLESNLIKAHQPPYNVLLKDDQSYPYICASVGDQFPRFFPTPRRQEGVACSKYRYFGPYCHFKEINAVLESIETKYDLRAKSFMARHGSSEITKEEYNRLFQQVLEENFASNVRPEVSNLALMRSEFEEAAQLFDSGYNRCRDVVAFAKVPGHDASALVHVVQLRDGLVAGRFSYTCEIPSGMSNDEDYAAAISHVLERQHYPSGEESLDSRFSFFPNEILIHFMTESSGATSDLKIAIRAARKKVEPSKKDQILLRTTAMKGPRKESDTRAMEFAIENAMQAASEKALGSVRRSVKSSIDGTALAELQQLLNLEKKPSRIECYDVSHNHGDFPVGSRVVFTEGKPTPSLYRKFNIKTVEGVDDYASLKETLSRRFKRAWVNGAGGPVAEDDPWSLPDIVLIDGGPGQLNAAVDALVSQRIYPAHGKTITGFDSSISGAKRSATVVVCSLAKNREELFVFGSKKPVNCSSDSPALLLMRALRDESHRFALTAHRKRRSIRKSS